jgi:Reverse transcriptase (RNA-dependent DNA polymerase)
MAKLKPQLRSINTLDLFDKLFSAESVIRELCKERAKLAKKRNDRQFLHRISKDTPGMPSASSEDKALEKMFPPRRRWHSFRARNRGTKPSYDLNVEALFRAVMTLRAAGTPEPWAEELDGRVQEIRRRALLETPFAFVPPRISPKEKDNDRHKYRPLASFPVDYKIIDCLAARYLRNVLDHALRPSCLAFRSGHGKRRPPTIHDALKKLVDVNRRHRKAGQFVAECDIRGFFDCVSHDVARSALAELARDARKGRPGLIVHPRAVEIYEGYLRAYSFGKNVKSREAQLLANRDCKGVFKWPAAELKQFHGVPNPVNVGVPQGGALSCFIANAVLHAADKDMEKLKRDEGKAFTYLRYCDDMIILSRDSVICQKAFDRYMNVLRGKMLPIHEPVATEEYGVQFWKAKSRAPYLWSGPGVEGSVPWVQFVGYQVRYDGLVRVRPSSIKKQIQKMTSVADQLLKALNPGRRYGKRIPKFASGLRKSNGQIIHRLRQKLISMAVGRVRLGRPTSAPLPMSWANGFRGLLARRTVRASLKSLDRHRERQIHRVADRLKLAPKRLRKNPVLRGVHPYYGAPFSFCGQFPTKLRR